MAKSADGDEQQEVGAQRADKWLWYARVVKTRTLAASLIQDGRVRLNRDRISKPSQIVRPGDVLTISVHRHVRVLKVLAPGTRRGPACEAQELYEDLSPPSRPSQAGGEGVSQPSSAERERGAGRPTKRERRQLEQWRRRNE